MSDRLLVSTRKGLFTLVRKGAWEIESVSFLGDAVSLALADRGALYAALGTGHFGVKLRRSKDKGQSWQDVAAPAFPKEPEGHKETLPDGKPWPWRVEQIWSLEPGGDAGELWCGSIGGGLFHSRDGGDSWTFVQALWDHPRRKEWFGGGADLPGIHSICVHPSDPKTVLIGVSCGGVWRTHDRGETWELSSDGMFAEYMPPPRRTDPAIQDPHRLAQCKSRPERVWAQHHNGVFRSDDGGRTWVTIDSVEPSVFGFAVTVHPNDGDTAWLVPAVKDEKRVPVDGKVVVARTRDAGKSFTVLRDGLPQAHAYDLTFRHALDVAADGERLAFGSTTGSLWITESGGDEWTQVTAHLPPIYAVRFA